MRRVFPILASFGAVILVMVFGGGVVKYAQSQLPESYRSSSALGSGFTYQGYLTQGGSAADGSFDLQFDLFDAETGGITVTSPVTFSNVVVEDGLFTVALDFGLNAFNGDARWLEVSVRPGGDSEAYTVLAPRQAITAAPYALFATGADWAGLIGMPTGFSDGLDDDTLATLSCIPGQIVEWDGSDWRCGDDDLGGNGDIISVNAGFGLDGGGVSGDIGLSVLPDAVQVRVGEACPYGESIRAINQDGTVSCEVDDLGTGGGGGDITAVNAGSGLSGGGLTGTVTLDVGAGNGLVGLTDTLEIASSYQLPQICAPDQVTKWDGSGWSCGIDNEGVGDITAVNSGFGLTGGAEDGDVTLSVESSSVQSRIDGLCPSGQSIRAVNQDGTVICEADDDTIYAAGTGIDMNLTTLDLEAAYQLPQDCGSGQIPEWNNSSSIWDCRNDTDTTYSAGIGIVLSNTTFALSDTYRLPQFCSSGQIAALDGAGWICADPGNGSSGWSLTGNSGTVAGTNFLGTSDDEPLELHVYGQRGLLLDPANVSPNFVAGYWANSAGSGVDGATVGGGGRDLAINQAIGAYSTVDGGADNTAAGYASALGGGESNSTTGSYSVVGGGSQNLAGGSYAAVGGGRDNTTGADHTFIGGGQGNVVSGTLAAVGGGLANEITSTFGAIAGGANNTVHADSGVVGGGSYNEVSGAYGTIAGGGPYDPENPTTSNNEVLDNYGAVGGGGDNTAGSDDGDPASAQSATVSGGSGNTAMASYSSIGGGLTNAATGYGASVSGGTSNSAGNSYASISGGSGNTADGYASALGGGESNSTTGSYSVVGGGSQNLAGGSYAALAGGRGNTTGADYAAVGGGQGNWISGTFAAVGGGQANEITSTHGTIAGGADNTVHADSGVVGGGSYNEVSGAYGTIAGGGPSEPENPTTSNNKVLDNYGAVGGGGDNTAGSDDGNRTSASYATVGGGSGNTASGYGATVSGGSSNSANGSYPVVGGGYQNLADGNYALVAGGLSNLADGQYSLISGGRMNTATGSYSTVGGGFGNEITATAGTIPGGANNYVGGSYGFAAGNQARVEHPGSFVWSDSQGGDFTSTAPDQFLIDASGGVGIGTDNPSHLLTVEGSASVQSSSVISVGAIVSYSTILEGPRALYAVGDLLYATGTATNTLSIWNMSDPAAQEFMGYTTFLLQNPSDLQVVGSRAYLASTNQNRLTILDVSDPSDISYVGDTTEYLGRPVAVHVSGKYAYVASKGRLSPEGLYDGLTVIDITHAPAEGPTQLAATGFITTYLQGTSDVFVSGDYAYVTSRDNNRLVIFDVSDPGKIVPMGYTEASLSGPVQLHVSGIYAYVVAEGADTLVTFDISNPAQIAYVGQVTTGLTHPKSLYVSGDRAYMAYAGDVDTGEQCGLAVLDISDPANIAVLNVIDMSDWLKLVKGGTVEEPIWELVPPKPFAVTGSGNRVYVGNDGHDSVFVFEIDGLEASTIRTGELQVAQLEVADYAAIEGDLGVRGGLNVGPGGALIQGALTIEGNQDSTIRGRLGIGPVATVITRSISPTESESVIMRHPSHQLDVDGEARFRVNGSNHLVLRSQNTGSDEDAYIDFARFDHTDLLTPTARIEFDAGDPLTQSTSLRFYTQAPSDAEMLSRLEITAQGDVRPGADATYTLGVPGRRWHTVYSANGVDQVSDGRYKENVSALPYGLAEISTLRPVAFNWLDGPDDGTHFGLIAQEVRQVLPDIVSGYEQDGTLGMNYGELVPVLVNAIQEQQDQIESQTEQINTLEARLSVLEHGQAPVLDWLKGFNAFWAGGLLLMAAVVVGGRRWLGGRS